MPDEETPSSDPQQSPPSELSGKVQRLGDFVDTDAVSPQRSQEVSSRVTDSPSSSLPRHTSLSARTIRSSASIAWNSCSRTFAKELQMASMSSSPAKRSDADPRAPKLSCRSLVRRECFSWKHRLGGKVGADNELIRLWHHLRHREKLCLHLRAQLALPGSPQRRYYERRVLQAGTRWTRDHDQSAGAEGPHRWQGVLLRVQRTGKTTDGSRRHCTGVQHTRERDV